MTFDREYFNIGYLDNLSYKDTFIHRLDPRAKLIVSLIFVISVVSFQKYEITGLLPFFIYPVLLLTIGDIPFNAIARKMLFASPFALFIGIFNPLLDRDIRFVFLGMHVTGGWVSFLSIMIRFMLTVSTAILLVAVTSFPRLCESLRRLKVPKVFVVQLLFLYRYIFVLLEETLRMSRAKEMRSFGKRGKDMRTFIRFISVLLIRTLERAERVYQAMLLRGFNGEIKMRGRSKFRSQDILFVLFSISIFYIFRRYNIVNILGRVFEDLFR